MIVLCDYGFKHDFCSIKKQRNESFLIEDSIFVLVQSVINWEQALPTSWLGSFSSICPLYIMLWTNSKPRLKFLFLIYIIVEIPFL